MRMWKQLGAKVKKPGCCTLCDKEVYEIKTRWTKGILEGEPRKVGDRPMMFENWTTRFPMERLCL
jgi:hypothetical protein